MVEKIKNLSEFGIQLSTTPINVCELYMGTYKSDRPEENIKLIDDFLESITCLALKYDEVLVARNVRHFKRVKELKIEKW